MRMYSKAALACLMVAVSGCTFTLPNGLIKTAGGTGGNGGGTVSGNESCTALFFKLDANGDKELTEDEYIRGRMGNVQAAEPGSTTASQPDTGKPPTAEEKRQVQDVRTLEDDLRAGFKALDKDGNGRVTRDEFIASCGGDDGSTVKPTKTPDPNVPPIDKDRPASDCSPEFGRYDANQDGKWSRDEYEKFAARPIPEIAMCVSPNDGGGVISNNGSTVVSNDGRLVDERPVMDKPMLEPVCGTPPQYQTHPFEKYDLNRDGAIDAKEFCTVQGGGTIAVPPQPPTWDCKSTFLRADRNQDGKVSFDEYRQADYSAPPPDGMARPAVMPSDEEMKRRFLSMDRNGDQTLSAEEFCGMVIEPYPVETPKPGTSCEENFIARDRNRDRMIQWEEFYQEPGPNMDVTPTYKDDYYAKFKATDRNGDGHIDLTELCGGDLPPVMPPPPPTDKCTAEFKEFDRDGSGSLSYDEYAGGRYNQIRFIQAPSQEEAAKFIYDFKARAKAFDVNGDEKLTFEEFLKGCY